jgi:hypothetical protein
MTTDTNMIDVIAALIAAMTEILETALVQAEEAVEYAQRRQQSTTIGTLLGLDDSLEQCLSLYRAIIAVHRFDSRRPS